MGDGYGALTRTRLGRWWRPVAVAGTMLSIVPASGSQSGGQGSPRPIWSTQGEARGTPARDRESLFFRSGSELAAADRRTGRVIWRSALGGTAGPLGTRVAVSGNHVMAGDYDLVGLDTQTGARRWTFAPGVGHAPGLYLGDAVGEVVYTGSAGGMLHAVHTGTGVAAWSVQAGPSANSTVYAPVVGRHVFATFSGFDLPRVGGVGAFDTRTGREMWRHEFAHDGVPAGRPVVVEELVLVADQGGSVHAFGARTGQQVWVIPPLDALGGQPDFRPLAVAGRVLVAGSLSGEVVAYDMPSRRVRWRWRPAGIAPVSVAFELVARFGVVYVPYLSGRVVALRLSDGVRLWDFGSGGGSFTWVPLVESSAIYLAGAKAGLFAFRHGRYIQ